MAVCTKAAHLYDDDVVESTNNVIDINRIGVDTQEKHKEAEENI